VEEDIAEGQRVVGDPSGGIVAGGNSSAAAPSAHQPGRVGDSGGHGLVGTKVNAGDAVPAQPGNRQGH
jgi:hypothetical protein